MSIAEPTPPADHHIPSVPHRSPSEVLRPHPEGPVSDPPPPEFNHRAYLRMLGADEFLRHGMKHPKDPRYAEGHFNTYVLGEIPLEMVYRTYLDAVSRERTG